MIRELRMAVLTHNIPEYGLEAGDVGTVVHVYGGGDAYEVEFITAVGETVAVLTLTDEDVRPMKAQEILHARLLPATRCLQILQIDQDFRYLYIIDRPYKMYRMGIFGRLRAEHGKTDWSYQRAR